MKKQANWQSKEDMIDEKNIVSSEELFYEGEVEENEQNSISNSSRK